MFDTVLIANRGEIACRIIRTLRAMGIRSVAVFSDADADAQHVRDADVAVRIGPASAALSYLSIPAVMEAARRAGAQAIHPGYGFLAESASLAQACMDAGIVFIGPSVHAIATMGDKITAKAAVSARGVPVVPGLARPGLSDDELSDAAVEVGFPVLIKPSAGGGGKGMHIVEHADGMAAALAAARREASAAFGDDTLFLERFVQNPRHIEVQVLADGYGKVIHLGERECSLQRRHQKVIEEAPSPLLDEATRARIGAAACETARSVNYLGAGTVEFIVAADRPDDFFFMEMNTRLQVEHPVTEQVTGVDLVEQQVRVAAGEALTLTQSDIVLQGHSIEARVYAESPREGFLPAAGYVRGMRMPTGVGIRVDSGLRAGVEVTTDYDPMLAKIIATGADRPEALRRLVEALGETAVFGIDTNVEFLRLLLQVPEVVAGTLDTGLIERVQDSLPYAAGSAAAVDHAAVIGAVLLEERARANATSRGVWGKTRGWRLGEDVPVRYDLTVDGAAEKHTVRVGARAVSVSGGPALPVCVVEFNPREGGPFDARIDWDGAVSRVAGFEHPDGVDIAASGAVFEVRIARPVRARVADVEEAPEVVSPMPGTVVAVAAEEGALVDAGAAIVVVEAMKMEHVVRANVAGRVRLSVSVGDRVSRGQGLAAIGPTE